MLVSSRAIVSSVVGSCLSVSRLLVAGATKGFHWLGAARSSDFPSTPSPVMLSLPLT